MANNKIKTLLDLGLQPISNRYLTSPKEKEHLFPLKLGQCQETGLIQLIDPVPNYELAPKYDWLAYYEPESHLDNLVEKVSRNIPNSRDFIVGGISQKDDTTLDRFGDLGHRAWRLDPVVDLELSKNHGVESIQSALTKENAIQFVDKNDKANLIVARHIWEHVSNQASFSAALKELIHNDGYLLIEVPDCSDLIKSCDYTMPWEEHLYYFDDATLVQSLEINGFEVLELDIVPQPYENLIIALSRPKPRGPGTYTVNKQRLSDALKVGMQYAQGYIPQKTRTFKFLTNENKRRKIMLFGAGHSSCPFINNFHLGDIIEHVIDDNEHKQGLFMPKSGIPITDSAILQNDISALCLLAINPAHEEAIFRKFEERFVNNCKFLSIFPLSKMYLPI